MIISVQELTQIRTKHKDKKIVLTSGTFDLLHVGHVRYLNAVKQYGDVVVVMLSSDKRVKARKGDSRPIISEAERAQMLDALRVVDYVFIDPASSPPDQSDPVHAEILDLLQPDMYATDGPDPRFWDLLDNTHKTVVPRSEGEGHASTSAIIEYIIKTAR